MKILLTGATGYIGKRLLPSLVNKGYNVVCCVRDLQRFNVAPSLLKYIELIEVNLLEKESLESIPKDIDIAYYLVHSMSNSSNYEELEKQSAVNFREALDKTEVKQVIYLSGIVNESSLSQHLKSRLNVEMELGKGKYALTTLRAGIIIGSGSASFEIIRDLVEKLPIMVTPKWLNTRCQPIGVKDVIKYLNGVILVEECYNKSFDIGGPDVLTYKEMLLGFAKERGLKRFIYTLPIMTPRLSSYWLYFVTSTSYKLAVALVNSMKVAVVCRKSDIEQIVNVKPISYREALRRAFSTIESNEIISSWKDSQISGNLKFHISDFVNVPSYGCFKDKRNAKYRDRDSSIEKIWRIGGNTGWYTGNILWQLRGFIDKLVGGVGLRRGRTHEDQLNVGDAVDFWRVLYADKDNGRLLLFAEMKLPGEAWLEFRIFEDKIYQTATFRPKGLWGRIYWYSVLPLHSVIFNGMIKKISE